MKPIRIFRHEDWIQPGRVTEYLDARGWRWELVAVDEGAAIPPSVDDVAGLVFLGGTMSVNDGHPWLAAEMKLIRQAATRDVPILGHCLGSQLIAKALGATVAPMAAKEIGWHRVRLAENAAVGAWLSTVPQSVELLIWHHDAFALPPGALPLCSSEHCADQAFAVGNTVATVAHVEVTAAMLEEWLRIYGYDIAPLSPRIQSIEHIRERIVERCAAMHAQFSDRLYDAWIARVQTYSRREQPAGAA